MKPFLLAVIGPTGSGKTDLAEAVADTTGARLVNSDGFQVYRGMDVGTAKSARKAEYALLDLKDPDEPFGVGEFVPLAAAEIARCWDAGRSVVVVGGTGLNVRALFEGYDAMTEPPDAAIRAGRNRLVAEGRLAELVAELRARDPEAAARTDLLNPVRVIRALERIGAPRRPPVPLPPFARLKVGLAPDPVELHERIGRRTESMMHNGWVEEVMRLREAGYRPTDPGLLAHGYRRIWSYLDGETDRADALATTTSEVRRYAKRQRTWMRSEPGLVPITPSSAMLAECLERLRSLV